MLHLNPTLPKSFSKDSPSSRTNINCKDVRYYGMNVGKRRRLWERQRGVALVPSCSTSSSTKEEGSLVTGEDGILGIDKGQERNLVSEFGWRVKMLVEDKDEMWNVAQVQAEAFHDPMVLFNDLFFQYFKAEVFFDLVYKLRNSPPNRFACLVAEPTEASNSSPVSEKRLVGVVAVTVLRNKEVLSHLEGADEYLYISGIAVLEEFRRMKVATVLLKACDLLSLLWGFDYLALRAYEDDSAARRLYTNAGYRVVSGDPRWMTTWLGRKQRVLMIKQSSLTEPWKDQIAEPKSVMKDEYSEARGNQNLSKEKWMSDQLSCWWTHQGAIGILVVDDSDRVLASVASAISGNVFDSTTAECLAEEVALFSFNPDSGQHVFLLGDSCSLVTILNTQNQDDQTNECWMWSPFISSIRNLLSIIIVL